MSSLFKSNKLNNTSVGSSIKLSNPTVSNYRVQVQRFSNFNFRYWIPSGDKVSQKVLRIPSTEVIYTTINLKSSIYEQIIACLNKDLFFKYTKIWNKESESGRSWTLNREETNCILTFVHLVWTGILIVFPDCDGKTW